MALSIGDFVLRGEIINTDHYSVHGYLELRGCDRPLVFQLTGDCAEDLQGKHLRFAATQWAREDAFDADEFLEEPLSWQQIGPTGEITTKRVVPAARGRAGKRGKRLAPTLYVEWFGQNGRVVVEIPDPVFEFVDTEVEPEASEPSDWHYHPTLPDPETGPEPGFGPDADDPTDSDEDPYGLFPDGFEAEFESNAAETDRIISGSAQQDSPDSTREIELLDDLIESGDGDPIAMIFETPFRLRRPAGLEDDEVEVELKSLLSQLALYNIAIDVCEHFTPREAYEWLLEEILPKESAYPELRRTQWVQHFSTSDDCPECDAEFGIEELEDDYDSDADDPEFDDLDDDLPF